MCVFQGHFSSAKLWRGSTINRRGRSGEGGLREEEVCSEHLLVSKSRALAGLFRSPFSTRTMRHPQPLLQSIKTRAGAKCSGLGHHDPAPAHHHPKSTQTVPGRRGSVLLWTFNSGQFHGPPVASAPPPCLILVQNSAVPFQRLGIKPTHSHRQQIYHF